jgi:hypothetical protein
MNVSDAHQRSSLTHDEYLSGVWGDLGGGDELRSKFGLFHCPFSSDMHHRNKCLKGGFIICPTQRDTYYTISRISLFSY